MNRDTTARKMFTRSGADCAYVAIAAFPWLNAFTAGPSPNVWPWLISAACWFTLWLFRAKPGPQLLAWSCLFAGCASAAIGLVQYFGVSGLFNPWISQAPLGEAFGNLRQRNQFASLMNMALAGLVYMNIANARRTVTRSRAWSMRTGRGLHPALWLGGVMLLEMGNAASSSRTGLVELLLVCGLFWLWSRRFEEAATKRCVRRILLFALLTYAVAAVLLPSITGSDLFGHGMAARLKHGDRLCASRLTLWANVIHLIAQKPWWGWGWGELDYAHFITPYSGPRFCDILDNAHNLPLHLAVELGIPVALAVLAGLAWLLWRQRPWHETRPERQMAWAILAVIGLHSLLEYPLWYGPFQIAVLLCTGVLLQQGIAQGRKAATQVDRGGTDGRSRWWRRVEHLLPVCGLAILLWVSLDYFRISQIYLSEAERAPSYRGDTLNKIRDTRFFIDQVNFAELSTTPLTRANAGAQHAAAEQLLHFSPEPRVIERLIESAVMLGRDEEALFYLIRYREAFPKDHARWSSGQRPD